MMNDGNPFLVGHLKQLHQWQEDQQTKLRRQQEQQLSFLREQQVKMQQFFVENKVDMKDPAAINIKDLDAGQLLQLLPQYKAIESEKDHENNHKYLDENVLQAENYSQVQSLTRILFLENLENRLA